MKKNNKLVIIICTLVLILTLVGCSKKTNELSKYNYITTATIMNGDETFEINKCLDENLVLIVKNNEVIKKISRITHDKSKDKMELPPVEDRLNIHEKKKITSLTWEADLYEAGRYINYLKYKGYKIEFQANTEEFIEIYLKNPDNNNKESYKRIIVDGEHLIEAFTNKILFNNIENYII